MALREESFFSLLYTALFDVEDALASTLIMLMSLVFIVPMLVLVFTHTKNMITNETTNERNFRVRENLLHEEDSSTIIENERRWYLMDTLLRIFKAFSNCIKMSSCDSNGRLPYQSQEELLTEHLLAKTGVNYSNHSH